MNYFIQKSKEKHDDLYDYSLVSYTNNKGYVNIICKKHGIFNQRANHHLNGRGCPICKNSKGEIEIQKILINRNINHIQQKTFPGCKDLKVLPFDFYLPDHTMCIEFDGRHHFESIENWGGIKRLKNTQKHDQIKNIYCKENNIKLIRIKYDENIIDKINENFKLQ